MHPQRDARHTYTLTHTNHTKTLPVSPVITEQNYDAALKRSQRVMILLDGYTESQLANKMTFKANLHSIQGNAYLEMDDHENAAKQHLKDLCIGEEL